MWSGTHCIKNKWQTNTEEWIHGRGPDLFCFPAQMWFFCSFELMMDISRTMYMYWLYWQHGLINYTDTKAKYRHIQKLTCKGTLRQVFICLRTRTPYTTPRTHCIQYTYSHSEGGGGDSWTREKVRGATVHKAGSKYQHLQFINSDKHLPQSPFTSQFFYMTTFCFGSTIVD